jgi:ABC-type hemin transport system substrate-binding protein
MVWEMGTARIVSLVPHATELLFALGLEEEVIAVTHECDYPPRLVDGLELLAHILHPEAVVRAPSEVIGVGLPAVGHRLVP